MNFKEAYIKRIMRNGFTDKVNTGLVSREVWIDIHDTLYEVYTKALEETPIAFFQKLGKEITLENVDYLRVYYEGTEEYEKCAVLRNILTEFNE